MNLEIDLGKTKFHGVTYDEEKDRARLTGQMKRMADMIQTAALVGDGWVKALDLCKISNVSYSALRNRISDLRTYHAFKIKSERVKNGIWKYKFMGLMTAQEHQEYLLSLRMKKVNGDPVLWGKMWSAIYAYAAVPDLVNEASMKSTTAQWAMNIAHNIFINNKSI